MPIAFNVLCIAVGIVSLAIAWNNGFQEQTYFGITVAGDVRAWINGATGAIGVCQLGHIADAKVAERKKRKLTE